MKDKAYEYFINQEKNCAETVLLCYMDKYNIEVSSDTLKAVGAFGGGIGNVESVFMLSSICDILLS